MNNKPIISNIVKNESSPEHKQQPDYQVKVTVLCRTHNANFDVDYSIDHGNADSRVDCPVCGLEVILPSRFDVSFGILLSGETDSSSGCYTIPAPEYCQYTPHGGLMWKHRKTKVEWCRIDNKEK